MREDADFVVLRRGDGALAREDGVLFGGRHDGVVVLLFNVEVDAADFACVLGGEWLSVLFELEFELLEFFLIHSIREYFCTRPRPILIQHIFPLRVPLLHHHIPLHLTIIPHTPRLHQRILHRLPPHPISKYTLLLLQILNRTQLLVAA